MASIGRRVLVYLGLVDDEYEEYDHYEEPVAAPSQLTRRVPAAVGVMEPEPSGVRTLPREDPSAVQPRPAVVRTMPVHSAKVHVVAPGGFDDAKEIGDRLRANQPVIVNLQGSHRDLRRRLIDFASGLTYGLGGQMERVAEQVFLLTPTNVEVSAEEKRRLQERGLIGS
ncbi:MAG: cell division protein SepF [Acidimicrobiales bacterium]